MQLVDMHSSWLVINSIVGCTNGCKYCILGNNSNCKPKINGTPYETIKQLLSFKYYDEKLPLCLFPNTDIFLNQSNINYLLTTLDLIETFSINNPLIFITKCLIPDNVISKLQELKASGRDIVVYLSYSGLNEVYEPNINYNDILINFKNLKDANIPTIHYYRPFISQNSNPKKIREILSLINYYTDISAIMGLMYIPSIENDKELWKEFENVPIKDLKKAISIWQESAWDYFYKNYDSNQYFYQINSCALSTILKQPSQYYGSYECKNFNNCPKEQRERCRLNSISINKEDKLKQLDLLLKRLGYNADYEIEFDKEKGIKLNNIDLDVKTLAYLSCVIGIKVYVPNGKALNDIYNSTLNGGQHLILKKNKEQ